MYGFILPISLYLSDIQALSDELKGSVTNENTNNSGLTLASFIYFTIFKMGGS